MQDHAAPLEELGDLVDVAGHPGDQRAAPLRLLVQHGQVVHVPERPGPHVASAVSLTVNSRRIIR